MGIHIHSIVNTVSLYKSMWIVLVPISPNYLFINDIHICCCWRVWYIVHLVFFANHMSGWRFWPLTTACRRIMISVNRCMCVPGISWCHYMNAEYETTPKGWLMVARICVAHNNNDINTIDPHLPPQRSCRLINKWKDPSKHWLIHTGVFTTLYKCMCMHACCYSNHLNAGRPTNS